ncbi:MAG TPA: CoA transferase [Candidatus Binataceae bacterium]|nr:CoA transferase [Candidatus Binataceae bacterium]
MTTVLNGKIRVLDLSMGWAGPMVGQMMAELGAEVVKVEDTDHFDWWRGSLSVAPPEMQPIERSAPFNTANRGKLGVTLDLQDPRGVDLVKRLVAVSDMLIENYSPGVMERFGLDYATLAAINPRLIMVSMPSFGSSGPECNARGYGNTVEAMAGITGLMGYKDAEQRYTLSNALGDPVSGLHGTFGLLVALHERERTGRGQLIELAQVEALIPFVGTSIVECQLTGKVPPPRGNSHPEHAPYGIYACVGDHGWIALACESDEQWQAAAHALDLDNLADDARFTRAADRKANEYILNAELTRALGALQADDAVQRLLAVGVPAAPVNSAPAVIGDAHLAERGYFVAIDRAVVGTHLYPGGVARLPETPLVADQPAPLLGEHNADIFRRLLNLSDAEVAALEQEGIIGTAPREYKKAS